MNRDLVLVKLGGSLITDKRGEAAARHQVIENLATEIAQVAGQIPQRLVIGHGSGSFGHVAALRHGLGQGLHRADGQPVALAGVGATQDAAAQLHRLVMTALLEAGLAPFSVAPSSTFLAEDGRLVEGFLDPLLGALEEGLLPVLYGDVVIDRQRGVSICSTETVLHYLIAEVSRRGYRVVRLLWLGETDGIYDREGRTIPRVDAGNYDAVRRLIEAPAGTDVTGGMLLRLETARSLARQGIESRLFDGRRPGALAAALEDSAAGAGTLIAAEN